MGTRILRIDDKLVNLHKPVLEPVDAISLSNGDCLIVCAGFEERVLGVLNSVLVGGGFKVVIVEYLPFIPQNCSPTILKKCIESGIQFTEVTYNRQSPAGFGRQLLDATSDCRGRVIIDISGMSRLLIVQALVAFGKRSQRFRGCALAYTEAKIYPPTQEEAERALEKGEVDPTYSVLFLSSGVFDVTIIPELSAMSAPDGQTRLIAFPSLDAYQLTALRAELQPSRFSLIEGIPPDPSNLWRPDFIRKINRLDNLKHDVFCTSTLDYRETMNCLLQIYGKHSERERLFVSPTGSKMQTVAVGLLRAFLDDIQIVYPTPKDFRSPDNYTKGVGQIYSLALDGYATIPAQV